MQKFEVWHFVSASDARRSRRLKADFHLQKIFRGQERNGTEKLMGMRMGHVNRKIFCSALFRGKLNQVQPFLSFRTEKMLYDLSSQSDSFVA